MASWCQTEGWAWDPLTQSLHCFNEKNLHTECEMRQACFQGFVSMSSALGQHDF